MFDLFNKISSSKMFLFVSAILGKWYLMITVAALVVTFWVFKGLSDAGVIAAAEEIVFKALHDTKAVARYCVPKITNLSDFWDCVGNTPDYEPTEEEKALEIEIKKALPQQQPVDSNPYEQRTGE